MRHYFHDQPAFANSGFGSTSRQYMRLFNHCAAAGIFSAPCLSARHGAAAQHKNLSDKCEYNIIF